MTNKMSCKLKPGLSNQSVNLFQDEASHRHRKLIGSNPEADWKKTGSKPEVFDPVNPRPTGPTGFDPAIPCQQLGNNGNFSPCFNKSDEQEIAGNNYNSAIN